ncbi:MULTISPECIES: TetR/AcrR family transcriptional regulator [unclassified Sporolactobacillus]|uniref:TetR/AcrR family transcriptional regulator n=1 Tax=unclassified Sporolactobacillus TaxID=2628533 RepID=UPI0023675B85|nr:TetR/AcrR family transcriptional regulator [Sporolactobacillus sp. CQH2019]MDD9149590.1 TetR/AcrR family transcriptional regulator [Sporolactobacillus sp. CQH2019]
MKQNAKFAHTEEVIKETFIQIVCTKGFHDLTVMDITRAARINRGTFYLHYMDKFDLLEKYEKELLDKLRQIMKTNLPAAMDHAALEAENYSLYRIVISALNYVHENAKILNALISGDGGPHFLDKIKMLLADEIEKALIQKKGSAKFIPTLPEDYAKELILNSLLSPILFWISKKNPESLDEIADIIMKSQFLSPCAVLDISPPDH